MSCSECGRKMMWSSDLLLWYCFKCRLYHSDEKEEKQNENLHVGVDEVSGGRK